MKLHLNLIPVFVLVAVLAVSGCTSYYSKAPAGGAQQGAGAPAGGEVKEFSVEGSEFKFSPATISVKKGDRVRVTFKNAGTVIHNFNIAELGVASKTISPGGSDVLEFTADKSGTFAFYCAIGNHRANGMEGSIAIE